MREGAKIWRTRQHVRVEGGCPSSRFQLRKSPGRRAAGLALPIIVPPSRARAARADGGGFLLNLTPGWHRPRQSGHFRGAAGERDRFQIQLAPANPAGHGAAGVSDWGTRGRPALRAARSRRLYGSLWRQTEPATWSSTTDRKICSTVNWGNDRSQPTVVKDAPAKHRVFYSVWCVLKFYRSFGLVGMSPTSLRAMPYVPEKRAGRF